jgi:hypothetical protein
MMEKAATPTSAVIAQENPTRTATSIRLKRFSGRGPDIVRQPFHGFRFQGIGNRLGLDSIAFRAFEQPHL